MGWDFRLSPTSLAPAAAAFKISGRSRVHRWFLAWPMPPEAKEVVAGCIGSETGGVNTPGMADFIEDFSLPELHSSQHLRWRAQARPAL